jgi:uncharacterized protein YecE (DUF72 family)
MSALGQLWIGISGFRYPQFRGVFYPKGLKAKEELAFAASQFASIEINGSFYSLQRPESYAAWRDETPPNFLFAVKGGRYITHLRRLREVEVPLANFFASGVLCLGPKLGPFLWQFPPQLAFDPARFEAFFELLPRDTRAAERLAKRHDPWLDDRVAYGDGKKRPLRHAVEVRHPSFGSPEFIAMLRRHGVALVVADTARRFVQYEDVTADFVYVRLHGDEELYASGYTDQALSRWAARIEAWQKGGEPADAERASPVAPQALTRRDVYVYFDNDIKARAPFDAITLARLLGVSPSASNAKATSSQRPGPRRSVKAPPRDPPLAVAAAARRGARSRW